MQEVHGDERQLIRGRDKHWGGRKTDSGQRWKDRRQRAESAGRGRGVRGGGVQEHNTFFCAHLNTIQGRVRREGEAKGIDRLSWGSAGLGRSLLLRSGPGKQEHFNNEVRQRKDLHRFEDNREMNTNRQQVSPLWKEISSTHQEVHHSQSLWVFHSQRCDFSTHGDSGVPFRTNQKYSISHIWTH